jgi:uncharacterized membrane-anchored protein YhcB (DUF1043 family)
MPLDLVLTVVAAFAALAVGFLLGRRTGHLRERILELESQLEAVGKERELAQASVEAAKGEIKRFKKEIEDYRAQVVEHFTGTSGLLRDLTLQYRAVYDHLTHGATSLCPEGSVDLLEGLQPEQLPEGPSEPASDEAEPQREPEPSKAPPPGA